MTEGTTADSDKAEIARLAALPKLDYFRQRKTAAKDLGILVVQLDKLIEQARKSAQTGQPAPVTVLPKADFEICRDLAAKPQILEHAACEVERLGLIGERRAVKLVYLVLTSRLLERPICAAIKGPPSTGKNCLAEHVQKLFPESAFYRLTSMSPRALAYGTEPLEHRILILEEAAGLAEGVGAYLMRSLISEGRIRYETVDSSDGLKSLVIDRPGPTGLLVTTTSIALDEELETRMLSIPVTDTPEQTSAVLMGTAAKFAGREGVRVDLPPWHALQLWLEQDGIRSAIVPYAEELAAAIPPLDNRLRRDFTGILKLIQTHAILHQANRERDARGRVIAKIEDYAVVYELTADLIGTAVEASVPQTVRETVEAVRELIAVRRSPDKSVLWEPAAVSIGELAKHLKLDKSTVSRRVGDAVKAGYLDNRETRKGRPTQIVVSEPLPEDRPILPSPDTLQAADDHPRAA